MHPRYRPPLFRRWLNHVVTVLIRLGWFPMRYHILTVAGRRTGRPRSTPVAVLQHDGQRWLVAPYGDGDWARNLRAAGQAVLRRAGQAETVTTEEVVDAAAKAPVLKLYLATEPTTRKFFTSAPGSPVEAFAAEAGLHPVFRIVQA